MKIGLTGTIGSGKSTVMQALESHGWKTIDTDRLAREQLDHGKVKMMVQSRFGKGVLQNNGAIDRRALASRVFSDTSELRWLEDLLHPLIREQWTRLVKEEPDSPWVVEVPLLFEKKLESHFDLTLCIHCQKSIRWKRLRQKGLSDSDILRREACQISSGDKESRADYVLTNSGTISLLNEQIIELISRLRSGLPLEK